MPYRYDVEVVGLLASPEHRYDGRPDDAVAARPVERVDRIEVRAGLGVVGDRYFGKPAHRDASVTVLAAEAVEALAAELGAGPLDPLATRRNVVLRGAEVEALRGVEFSLDGIVLAGGRPAHPCAWLDRVLAPGAHRGMRGRGGVRCAPRSDGVLRLGPAVLRSPVQLDAARAGLAIRPPVRPASAAQPRRA
ncbi:molybdenum cofactor biosysynthesis protein [Modestobacter roseus]|nr:molybdenum cofactor biosysynthesis protein [Modestobacter roseus]